MSDLKTRIETMFPTKPYLSPKDIASLLDVCVKTVDRFARLRSCEWIYITSQQRVLERQNALDLCDDYVNQRRS